ncbi:centrosome-associated protein ALMS1 [Anolis carolinensis]|uniref:ALMS motif domain-containing protein n=1 Tax=Anolis carolinensis TaxID=28377 RepID=H9GFA3_ANOCA|nr:PREDICTED: Alstrom syndrome protein 1 [Anolis carolinensis]|eukprot:XP_008120249.1 PREDICTED: Alstrom syndrome protein 1 [Anolis carolinensis]
MRTSPLDWQQGLRDISFWAMEKEENNVPPITTTPPHFGQKEELLSQSSSGTHISNASGFSLGEVIRRRSSANRETEEWYQPCTEVDASNLIVSVGWRLGQTPGARDLTEFPTMEEGLVTPSEMFRRQHVPNVTQTPLLEIQDSCLSPRFPLLATYSTQGQTFFNETIFQPTEMDFAVLRGIPDVSNAVSEEPSRCLPMREAVRLAAMDIGSDPSIDGLSLTQHPLTMSSVAPYNTSLSQHPLSLSGNMPIEQRNAYSTDESLPLQKDCKTFGSKDEISRVFFSPKIPNQQLATALTPAETCGIFRGQDPFLLESTVPAPVLEKDVGLSKQHGSSERSSGESVVEKDPEKNEMSQVMKDVVLIEREPETFVEPHQPGGTISELDLMIDSEGKPVRRAGGAEKVSANIPEALVSIGGLRVGLGDSCSNVGVSSRPLQSTPQMQQVSELEQKRKLVPLQPVTVAAEYSNTGNKQSKSMMKTQKGAGLDAPVPLQPVTVPAEYCNTGNKQTKSMTKTQKGASKNEPTLLDFTIEREHKDTGISPSFNEGSFFGHLAHPVHHSTPGLFATRKLEASVTATPFPSSPLSCLHEEISKNPSGNMHVSSVEEPRVRSVNDTCVPFPEKPLTLQSEQEKKNENIGDFQGQRPLKGRIKSLPSLNYMEKVGAWNMSQSAEKMSDALAVHGPGGISPRQKAFSAIADSLNSILLKHQSQVDLKPGSAASLCEPKSTAYDKKSPHALPLTRSQSENSVSLISREMPKTKVGHEKIQGCDLPSREDKGQVSEDAEVKQSIANKNDVETLLLQPLTAALVSAVSSDEEAVELIASGKGSSPDNFITSERVAELLREESRSFHGCQEKPGGSPDTTQELPGFHLSANRITMDHFTDVSPDSLNQLSSSGAGSCLDLRLSSGPSSRRSSAISGKLQSSLEDILQTPVDREMNIEERIPVYLHNLGIDQSPSSILTPFMPRGPIREIELSPTELRTLKASTDLLTHHVQGSEGGRHSVINAMQSSFDSSIFSGTVPAGSQTGPGSPLPTALRSQSSVCHQFQLPASPTPGSEGTSESPVAPQSAERSQVTPEVPSDSHSKEQKKPECVQALTDRINVEELAVCKAKPFPNSEAQENIEKGMNKESTSLHVISEEEREDSLIGSKTLKEIEKLLAETASRTSGRNVNAGSPFCSSAELDCSLEEMKSISGSGNFGPVTGASAGFQRVWSWDETLSRQHVQDGHLHAKALSLTGSLKWEGLLAGDFCSKGEAVPEKTRPTGKACIEEVRKVKPVGRSEPEGCNSVVSNKSLPVSGNGAAKSGLGSPRDLKELQATFTVKPLNVLENVQQILEKTKGGGSSKEMGSSHESENSSSVDSLGIRVKHLLQYERPVPQKSCWLNEQEPIGGGPKHGSLGASLAGSKGNPKASQSDNSSSSLDSLAVRVRSLLEEERPVMHAIEILQSAEEEEAKVHAWVKLKRAAQPPYSVPELNEEDRRMIEQIKREQSLKAQGHKQGPLWRNERISSSDPVLKANSELSKLPGGTELQKATHTHNFQLTEFPEVNTALSGPRHGTSCALQNDLVAESSSRMQSHVPNQLQIHSDNSLDSKHIVHFPIGSAIDTDLMELTSDSRALAGHGVKTSTQAKLMVNNSSTEPAKQITSITFASRKRSYSPSASCSGLQTPTTPSVSALLRSQPVNNEWLTPDRLQQEPLKPGASAGVTPIQVPDQSVGFSLGRGGHQGASIIGIKDESRQEENSASVGKSQADCIVQKIHYKEAQPSSQIFTEPRSGRLVGDVCDHKPNPKGMVDDLSYSTNIPQQKVDDASPQSRFADGTGSFSHASEPKGTLIKDNKFTFDSHLSRAEDRDVRSSSPLPSPSGHKAVVMPGSPPSQTRKALSGVHITISPKRVDMDHPFRLDSGAETRQVERVKSNLHPATVNVPASSLEATSKSESTDLSQKTQKSSYFPLLPVSQVKYPSVQVETELAPRQTQELLGSRQNVPTADQSSARSPRSSGQSLEESAKTTAASQTERMSSDAITQITTESPEKTTYSAEIFVRADSNEMDAPRHLPQKRLEFLSTTTADVNQRSILSRQSDPPLLVPYKPPGSSEMYYVPCSKEALGLSRIRSETTVESSHSGSNDAIPPKFPAQVLGSREENPPDAVAIKHKEGIYSKRPVAKDAWTEEKMSTQEEVKDSARTRAPIESVKTTHSVFRPGEFYLHQPAPLQHEIDFLSGSEALRQYSAPEHPATSSKDFFQHKGTSERSQAPLSLHHRKGDERFSPLTAEIDYSFVEELPFSKDSETDSPRKEAGQPDSRKTGHEVVKEPVFPGHQRIGLKENLVVDHPVRRDTHFTGGLDELWTKYLDRQKQRHPLQHCPDISSSRNELSLVERLDRLARLLQNPVRHSLLVPAKNERSHFQEEAKGKEPKKMSSQGRVAYKSNLAPHSTVEESSDVVNAAQLPKSRPHKVGAAKEVGLMDVNNKECQDSETLSEDSSEMRPVKGSSVFSDNTSESGVTQLETESGSRTEASGSISTIDTARLIRAFGQDRVHISPKLSQLYSIISFQKTRSEKRAKGSRKARVTDHPKTALSEPAGKSTQATDSFISSDSVSTAGGTRGPSSALNGKRSTRMLNKAIQAGDFEIVNSATKKHTRDVGLTFPTPTSSQARFQVDLESGMEDEVNGRNSESKSKPRRQPNGFFAEKRPGKSKSQWPQGLSWFVPTEELKADPKRGVASISVPEPGPSWFEPLPSGKPWREPLREKNWQEEDRGGLQVRLAVPARDIENNPPSPFVKITLQEALALRRPDFISSSGERVKRLKLIIEERKLQNMLQGERENLFNPPEQRRSYRNSVFLPNRDYRIIRRKRAISKNEMVQRSKRIYEQLPEVRRRREEEKRKSEYSTNRLKAQLYKTKITNRVLGRKVPWE